MMPSSSPLKILQITDLHLLTRPGLKMSDVNTEHSFCQTLQYAHDQHGKFDLILVTGDLAQDPCQFAYQRIYEELEKYQYRAVCLPGNHDEPVLMESFIAGELVNCDKKVLFKNWQIINLNSKKQGTEGGYLASEELNFLSQSLNEHPGLNVLIAVHHHPLPTKSEWLDTMIIENRDALFLVVDKYPQVKAIIFGHIHQKLETTKNHVQILGTPSTCFQFKPNCVNYALDNKPSGYRYFQLYPDGQINTKVYYLPLT
jgi:Icc protein